MRHRAGEEVAVEACLVCKREHENMTWMGRWAMRMLAVSESCLLVGQRVDIGRHEVHDKGDRMVCL